MSVAVDELNEQIRTKQQKLKKLQEAMTRIPQLQKQIDALTLSVAILQGEDEDSQEHASYGLLRNLTYRL